MLVIVGAVLIGCSVIFGIYVSNYTLQRMENIHRAAEAIQQGDLTVDVKLYERGWLADETDVLSQSIRGMQIRLRDLVATIRHTADKVRDSAMALSLSARELDASALDISLTMSNIQNASEEQAQKIRETTDIIREIADGIAETSELVAKADDAATKARGTAEIGSQTSNQALERLKLLFARIQQSVDVVGKFGHRVGEIGRISDIITKISQETNLLAINATIEAARAGELGRGFAAVADEVRKLAENAGVSAEQISELIGVVKRENETVLRSINETMTILEVNRETVDELGHAMQEIARQVITSTKETLSISSITTRQTSAAAEMVVATDTISRTIHSNTSATLGVAGSFSQMTASMGRLSKSAGDLFELANQLAELTNRFKT